MTGGGIERVLRSASTALTGRPSIRRSVKTDRNERFSAQRKTSVFSECRPLQRSGGGRAARAALLRHHWAATYRPSLAAALVFTTGAPRRVGGRIARRVAAASRWGLSAQWRGTGAVTGGD